MCVGVFLFLFFLVVFDHLLNLCYLHTVSLQEFQWVSTLPHVTLTITSVQKLRIKKKKKPTYSFISQNIVLTFNFSISYFILMFFAPFPTELQI